MPTIHLAHDGSVNGDWVGHYALRFAARTESRILNVWHVAGGRRREESFAASRARLLAEADAAGVQVRFGPRLHARNPAAALEEAVPAGAGNHLLAGARVNPTGRGALAGTVTERLLERARRDVLALRVIDPGLLGVPRAAALALSGNPWSVARALPYLRLLGLEWLVLVRVMTLSPSAFARLTPDRAGELEAVGRDDLVRQARLLRGALRQDAPAIDRRVVVSDGWPMELVVEAARARAKLLLLGATERGRPRRLLFGNPLERVLQRAPCDVGVFRAARS